MDISEKDIPSEYILAHVMMAGRAEQVQEILDNMEVEDFWDEGVQKIFNTVKEEADQGNVFSGKDQFMNIHTKHLDRFTAKNFHLNPDNKNYTDLTNFYLLDEAPDDTEMRSCMQIVQDKHALRDMIQSLYESMSMCLHEDKGATKAAEYMTTVSEKIMNRNAKEQVIIPKIDFSQMMIDLANECNDAEKRKERTINMPWIQFQNHIGGFHSGELVIVSAKSGNGKSAFSINIGIEAGVIQNVPTLYINSEMDAETLTARYLSYMCKIDSRKFLAGEYRDEDADGKYFKPVMDEITVAADRYAKGKLLFATIPDLQLSNIETIVRKDYTERQTKLIIVDYIGRMDITKTTGVKDLQEWQIMRLAANRLKTLAQKYHACVIMVAQLTDEGTLQGAKAMKNEADLWLSINRLKDREDNYKGKNLSNIFPYNTIVTVEKARSISDNTKLAFRYEGAMMTFSDSKVAIKAMIDKNRKYKDENRGKDYTNKLMTDTEYEELEKMVKQFYT
jgi:replicative DNA helicase